MVIDLGERGEVEFPDDMSEEQRIAALKKHFPDVMGQSKLPYTVATDTRTVSPPLSETLGNLGERAGRNLYAGFSGVRDFGDAVGRMSGSVPAVQDAAEVARSVPGAVSRLPKLYMDTMGPIPGQIADYAKAYGNAAMEVARPIYRGLASVAGNPVVESARGVIPGTVLAEIHNRGAAALRNPAIRRLINGVKRITQPVYDAVGGAMADAYNGVNSAVGAVARPVYDRLGSAMADTYSGFENSVGNVVDPIYNAHLQAGKAMYGGFTGAMASIPEGVERAATSALNYFTPQQAPVQQNVVVPDAPPPPQPRTVTTQRTVLPDDAPKDPAQRQPGKVYWTPKAGPMRWNGSAWERP